MDKTAEMLAKARQTAATISLLHVEFREGLAEALPVEDAWADVVITNGGHHPVRRQPGGVGRDLPDAAPGRRLQFADSANGRPCLPRRCTTSTCGPVV